MTLCTWAPTHCSNGAAASHGGHHGRGDTVSKTTYQEAIREAQQAEVILYSIIIVPIENSAGRDIGGEHALIQLSRDTGESISTPAEWRNWTPPSARSAMSAHSVSDRLLPSKRIADSDYRRIDIKINPATKDYPDPSELAVRHRTGYYTMPSK